MTVERRTFLKAAAGGALLAGPFSGLVAGQALAAPRSAQRAL
ncbi:twin-arginine translocation signal domain-containing protein, partial [Segeticoccus rhizosphaerae]